MFIEYTPLEVEVFILSLNSPLLKCLTALKLETGTSLVGQCLRLHLRIRGLRIQSLVRELRSRKTKTENRSNIVTNSLLTLKINRLYGSAKDTNLKIFYASSVEGSVLSVSRVFCLFVLFLF